MSRYPWWAWAISLTLGTLALIRIAQWVVEGDVVTAVGTIAAAICLALAFVLLQRRPT